MASIEAAPAVHAEDEEAQLQELGQAVKAQGRDPAEVIEGLVEVPAVLRSRLLASFCGRGGPPAQMVERGPGRREMTGV